MDVVKSNEYLLCDFLQPPKSEIRLWLVFPVEFIKFIEIIFQELCDNEQVFLVVEVIIDFEYILFIYIAIEIDVFQEFNLVDTLVEVVLVVLNDLEFRVATK